MFTSKLKIYFIINIAFLLLAGMILTDLILININHKALCDLEISRGHLFISFVEEKLKNSSRDGKFLMTDECKYLLRKITHKTGFSCALFLEKKYMFGMTDLPETKLFMLAKKAMRSGTSLTSFEGLRKSFFWPQKKYLVISSPLRDGKQILAGISILFPLKKTYQSTIQSQKILFSYILINTFVLTFIGVRRFSKITIKPLHRLLKRAEEFDGTDDPFSLYEKDTNEFNNLSVSLNRMLKRISKDKKDLKKTVDALKEANTDLKNAQKKIVQMEKLASIGRLSAGLAHEIGNPVSIVLGYFDLLKREDVSDGEKKDYIQRSENEINRINNIIRQLLDFSREGDSQVTAVSVHDLIRELVDGIKSHPLVKNMTVEVSLCAENDIIFADSEQLRQVFMNLIMNAADAINDLKNISQGKISITTKTAQYSKPGSKKRSPAIKIELADNGPGILKENMDNIFDPFFTTKEPGKGTGLGLFVCFMIIEKYGGTIKASGKKENGSRITIHLPVNMDRISNEK